MEKCRKFVNTIFCNWFTGYLSRKYVINNQNSHCRYSMSPGHWHKIPVTYVLILYASTTVVIMRTKHYFAVSITIPLHVMRSKWSTIYVLVLFLMTLCQVRHFVNGSWTWWTAGRFLISHRSYFVAWHGRRPQHAHPKNETFGLVVIIGIVIIVPYYIVYVTATQ